MVLFNIMSSCAREREKESYVLKFLVAYLITWGWNFPSYEACKQTEEGEFFISQKMSQKEYNVV